MRPALAVRADAQDLASNALPQTVRWDCGDRLALEGGDHLDGFSLTYTTLGRLSAAQDNIVWVLHPLTCSSDVTEWWLDMVGPGKALDPSIHFIICANTLGSCHGSTGPTNGGGPNHRHAGLKFPQITMGDVVSALDRLRRHLNIDRIALGVGGSYGGQQLFEWMARAPDLFEHACIIGASDRQSPWAIAFNEAQRMALEADPTFGTDAPNAGSAGLAAARAIAILSYRNAALYASTQADADNRSSAFRASAYQRAVGEKFARWFDACSYWMLTRIMDSHNIYRGRGTKAEVLTRINSRCLLVALEADVLFPASDVFEPATLLPAATCLELPCDHGHDSILTHAEALSARIVEFMASQSRTLAKAKAEIGG